MNATLRMCQAMKQGKRKKIHFLPTRTRNVPSCKIWHWSNGSDVNSLQGKDRRQEAQRELQWLGTYLWQKVINMSHNYLWVSRFHHKISSDGVAVSILLSRKSAGKLRKPISTRVCSVEESEGPRSRSIIGVDPGRKNLITATNGDGNLLRYTSRQRLFECKEIRHREVLERENKKSKISEPKAYPFKFDRQTRDHEKYKAYLV